MKDICKEMVDEVLIEQPPDFNERRMIAENDDEICKLVRNDLIDDFILHVNKFNINLNSLIQPSIFETNSIFEVINDNRWNEWNILNRWHFEYKQPTLIEYAALFGSIQIII